MISAFGPAAERYAAGLPPTLDAVISDEAKLGHAFLEAVKRRERAEPFYAMMLREDRRSRVTAEFACGLVAATPDREYCDEVIQQLARADFVVNGQPLGEQWVDDPIVVQTARELAILADALLVRSFADYAWFANLFSEHPAPAFERVVVEPRLDAAAFPARAAARPGIVIWAPRRPASLVALHAFALATVRGEVTIVACDATLPTNLPLAVLTPDDPQVAEALSRATCIVCVEPEDPGDAIAFARRGYGVVAPVTSGAHEYVADAQVWDGCTIGALYAAAMTALGRPARVAALPPPPPALRAPVARVPITGGEVPLVSILMPTYNRPALLRQALSSVAAQTYPRIEAVVVNDAGSPVDDVVADFSFARLIVHAENRGVMGACETGFHAARGEYITFLPDDDWVYPDHVTRVMAALLNAGAGFAHSAALMRFFRTAPDGGTRLRGFNMHTFSKTVDVREALVASTVSLNQCIQHRRVFDELGWFIEDNAVTDNEFHMRLLQRYTPVFVPNVTCEFRDYEGGSVGKSADLGAALRRVYDELHPFPDRPILNAVRAQTLAAVATRVPGVSPFPPSVIIP